MRRAVFLDLNGTLVLPLKVETPTEYSRVPRAVEAVAMLSAAGFRCPVVTVQSRIEKGLFTEDQFRIWFESFRADLAVAGAVVDGPFLCPHRPRTPCECKKTTGLLYRRAAAELKIDIASSFVVGDTIDDMEAARVIGCPGILVRTGWPVRLGHEEDCAHVAVDLLSASQWIVARAQ